MENTNLVNEPITNYFEWLRYQILLFFPGGISYFILFFFLGYIQTKPLVAIYRPIP